MLFTVLNFPILSSYSTNQNHTMAAEIPPEPRYGEDGAVLHNFRQKHQPHRPLVKAIGDDKETMERCAVWGVNWLSPPPGPLPEANKQSYLRQKDRKKRKKRSETKMKAKTKAKAKAQVKLEAKAAVLKDARERKKRPRPRPSKGATPMLQPNAATHAPATMIPAPAPSTTQWTWPSDRRAPSLSLPWIVAPWQASGWVAMDRLRPRAPAPTISTFYPSRRTPPVSRGVSGEYEVRVAHSDISQAAQTTTLGPSLGPGTSGGSSQHAMAGNLYVPQAYHDRVAQQGRAALATPFHPPNLPACFAPRPYRPTPSLMGRLEQYAASVIYAHGHLASQGLNAISPVVCSDHCNISTNVLSLTPSYSGPGSGCPSMDSSPSPPSTCAETPGWSVTPLPPHTASQPNAGPMAAHGSVGTIDYFSTTSQSFIPADRRLSCITAGLTPELIEYNLKTTQKVNGEYVPQADPPAMVNNYFNVTLSHDVWERDRQVMHEVVQTVQPPRSGRSVVWSAPTVVSAHIDRERSDKDTDIQGVPVQYQSAPRPTMHDVAAHSMPRKSSYSELSQALQNSTRTLIDGRALSSKENQAASSWITASPKVDVDINAHSSSSDPETGSAVSLHPAATYAQGPIIHHAWQAGMITHLWSGGVYAPPLYPYNDRLHISTIPSSRGMVDQTNLTHIDIEHLEVHHGHWAPA
ncbi:hypothetical protein V8D89_001898 [Ganoderma adspersum]